jgi:hypothetical protein
MGLDTEKMKYSCAQIQAKRVYQKVSYLCTLISAMNGRCADDVRMALADIAECYSREVFKECEMNMSIWNGIAKQEEYNDNGQ